MTFGPRREARFNLEPGQRVEVALLDAGKALTLRLDRRGRAARPS